jgi:type IV secretory pathway VirB4 component
MPVITTQQLLEIEEIKEGLVILKDKSLRGILMVSSINFDLKSEEEQKAIIYQFQSFLNSLDFSIQLFVQSRRLNMTGYLDKLKELEKKTENKLLRIQTMEYRKFITDLLASGTIMTKNFFVVVPFTFSEILSLRKKEGISVLTNEQFQRAKTQIFQRMEFVTVGLRRCGLRVIPLNTSELIELFWSLYHPEEAEVGYYPEIIPELLK